MKSSHRSILALVMAAIVTVSALPCLGEEKGEEKKEEKKEDIWTEEEPRRGWGRFELTDEEIDRVMKGLKERDPAKAKELAKLREKDREKLLAELRRVAREELDKILWGRFEAWRNRRRAEFLEWLGKNYRKESRELARLKNKDPDVYAKKYDLIYKKYGQIFNASRRSAELAKVLKADLELKTRRDELLAKLKTERDPKKKKKLASQLEEVVASRFDLIIRRTAIAYERLLKRLEELTKHIKDSKDQIDEWRKPQIKEENVRKRLKDLTEGIPKFNWD